MGGGGLDMRPLPWSWKHGHAFHVGREACQVTAGRHAPGAHDSAGDRYILVQAGVAMGPFSALFTNNDGGPSLGGKITTAWRFLNSPFGVLKHHDNIQHNSRTGAVANTSVDTPPHYTGEGPAHLAQTETRKIFRGLFFILFDVFRRPFVNLVGIRGNRISGGFVC